LQPHPYLPATHQSLLYDNEEDDDGDNNDDDNVDNNDDDDKDNDDENDDDNNALFHSSLIHI
jgi:hypothetical protein